MSKYSELFSYLRTCPALADLWSVAAEENIGVRVVLPQGASPVVQYNDRFDVVGNYSCDIIPYPSVYEDYQINCFEWYDPRDSGAPEYNRNVLALDDVQGICDWIAVQNEAGNLPRITGRKVVAIECLPNVPQIRYVNEEEGTIGYFITIRVRYVNEAKRREIEFDADTLS